MPPKSALFARRLTLAACIGSLALSVAPRADAPADARAFAVEYLLGTEPLKKYRNLKLTVEPTRIVGRAFGEVKLSIPTSGIVAVTCDERPHRPLDLSRPVAGRDTTPDLVAPAALAVVEGAELAAASTPFVVLIQPDLFLSALFSVYLVGAELAELNDRYVYVVWRDGGTVHDALVHLDRNRARALLDTIEHETGTRSVDLPTRRREFLDQLEGLGEHSVALELERDALVGHTMLGRGSYRLAVVKTTEDQAELFFFAGKRVRAEKLAAVSAARIGDQIGARSPIVRTDAREGLAVVSEIVLDTATLRLPPSPLPWEPAHVVYGGAPALRFEAGGGRASIVDLVERNGERAFRFPVVAVRMPVSSGYLYVMRDRIVYEPVHNPRSAPLVLWRAAIREVEASTTLGVPALKIRLEGNTHTFRPLYARGEHEVPSLGMKKGQRSDAAILAFFRLALDDPETAEQVMEGVSPLMEPR